MNVFCRVSSRLFRALQGTFHALCCHTPCFVPGVFTSQGCRILIGLASHEIRIIGPILLRFPPHSEAGALCPRLLICVLHGRALWYKRLLPLAQRSWFWCKGLLVWFKNACWTERVFGRKSFWWRLVVSSLVKRFC